MADLNEIQEEELAQNGQHIDLLAGRNFFLGAEVHQNQHTHQHHHQNQHMHQHNHQNQHTHQHQHQNQHTHQHQHQETHEQHNLVTNVQNNQTNEEHTHEGNTFIDSRIIAHTVFLQPDVHINGPNVVEADGLKEQQDIPPRQDIQGNDKQPQHIDTIRKYSAKDIKTLRKNSRIAKGKFSALHICSNKNFQNPFAAKVFLLLDDIKDDVVREISKLAKVYHPNIVSIFGFVNWSRYGAVLVEYVDGGNLGQLLQSKDVKEIPYIVLVYILHGVSKALVYLHTYDKEKACCHGGLNRDSILLTKGLWPKLAYFGVCHRIKAGEDRCPCKTITRSPPQDMLKLSWVICEMFTRKPVSVHDLAIDPKIKEVQKIVWKLSLGENRIIADALKDLMITGWGKFPERFSTSEQVVKELDDLQKRQNAAEISREIEKVIKIYNFKPLPYSGKHQVALERLKDPLDQVGKTKKTALLPIAEETSFCKIKWESNEESISMTNMRAENKSLPTHEQGTSFSCKSTKFVCEEKKVQTILDDKSHSVCSENSSIATDDSYFQHWFNIENFDLDAMFRALARYRPDSTTTEQKNLLKDLGLFSVSASISGDEKAKAFPMAVHSFFALIEKIKKELNNKELELSTRELDVETLRSNLNSIFEDLQMKDAMFDFMKCQWETKNTQMLKDAKKYKRYFGNLLNLVLDKNSSVELKPEEYSEMTTEVLAMLIVALLESSCEFTWEQAHNIAKKMRPHRFREGEKLLSDGTLGDTVYVPLSGKYVKTKYEASSNMEQYKPTEWSVKLHKPIGDTSVYYGTVRPVTCTCKEPGMVWYISKVDFKEAMANKANAKRIYETRDFLREIQHFHALPLPSLNRMARKSKVLLLWNGDVVDNTARFLIVVKKGRLDEFRTIDGVDSFQRSLNPQDIILTESYATNKNFYVATITETSDAEEVQCIYIPKREIDEKDMRALRSSLNSASESKVYKNLESHLSKENEDTHNGLTETTSSGYTSGFTSRSSSSTVTRIPLSRSIVLTEAITE